MIAIEGPTEVVQDRDRGAFHALADSTELDVRVAETPEDRDRIFRLRHRVLGDLDRDDPDRIASNGRVVDASDAVSHFLAGFTAAGEAVAALRVTPLDRSAPGRVIEGLRGVLQRRRGGESTKDATTSESIALPAVGRHVQVRLVAAFLKMARERGWREDLVAVPTECRRARRGLGYEDFGMDLASSLPIEPRLRVMRLVFPTPVTAPRRSGFGRLARRSGLPAMLSREGARP